MATELNVAAFFMLAVLSSEVFGVVLAGYASASKWSLFGGVREAAQVVSYEVPRAMCVVVPICVAGTLNLNTIGNQQVGWFWNWHLFHDPFTFVAFFIFFICATASCKRAPFDLAEAESELVAGFHTEYSGLRWSIFFLAEYGSMFAVSGLASLLFLGGWHTGLLPFEPSVQWGFWLGNLLNIAVFVGKCWLLVLVMMWIRWSLPRLRIDQVMDNLPAILPADQLCVAAGRVPVALAGAVGRGSRGEATCWRSERPRLCSWCSRACSAAGRWKPRAACCPARGMSRSMASACRQRPHRPADRNLLASCVCGPCNSGSLVFPPEPIATMSLPVVLFAVLATVTAISALGVVLSRNIVRMAVWLLFTLIGVSLLYFLLGAEFVGAAQLIVYVGGTLVLVVFGVMLTAQGPLRELRTRPAELVVGGVLGAVLFGLLVAVSFRIALPPTPPENHLPGVAPLGPGLPGRDGDERADEGNGSAGGTFNHSHTSGVPAAVRNRVGSPAGRAGRRGLSCTGQAEEENW